MKVVMLRTGSMVRVNFVGRTGGPIKANGRAENRMAQDATSMPRAGPERVNGEMARGSNGSIPPRSAGCDLHLNFGAEIRASAFSILIFKEMRSFLPLHS